MTALSQSRIGELLLPYAGSATLQPELLTSLQAYLELLLRWNERTNLTSIRDPEELVQRQFGESLFAAQLLPDSGSLLDFGSGGGFPGIPLQLVRPGLQVMLAESQGKKASFLREAVRTLGLRSEVWNGRVETLPAGRVFDTVAMRAVDLTAEMLPVAADRVTDTGALLRFTGAEGPGDMRGWEIVSELQVPRSSGKLCRSMRSG